MLNKTAKLGDYSVSDFAITAVKNYSNQFFCCFKTTFLFDK